LPDLDNGTGLHLYYYCEKYHKKGVSMSQLTVSNRPALPHYPPEPPSHPVWGSFRDFQADPLGHMGALVRQYGPAVRIRFVFNWYGYILVHPDHNKHILQDNNKNYTKQAPSLLVTKPLLGNGLVTSDGDFWRRQRRLIQPAFHRQRIAGFGATMTTAAETMIQRWQGAAERGETLDIDKEMMRLTLEVAGKTLFSMDLTGEAEQVGQAITFASRYIAEASIKPFAVYTINWPTPGGLRLRRAISLLDRVVQKIVDTRRRDNRDEGDLLSMLLQARDEETGAGMDDRQVRDEVMTLLLAGHETTSNTLTWTLYLLSQHPEIAERLRTEVDQVLAGRTPTIEDLAHLPYTRMVIEEAMRLYPPAYVIARLGVEPDVVGGYDIPAQAIITMSPYLTHRLPEFWPQPEKFDPERFTPDKVAERPRYAYIPFGGGPRQCIGNVFALTEAQLVLALIMQRARLSLAPGYQAELEQMITLRPRHGLPMRVTLRG
jgi:cytochrome P450